MNELLSSILDAVQTVPPVLRLLLSGLAMLLETSVLVGLIVPGDTVVIVAATAVASVPEAVALGAAVVIGALAGESIGYLLGRFLGPRIRHSALGRWIGEPNWLRSERYLRRRGGPAIFLSRFLPVLHSLVPLTVGMTGYPYRRFLAWTAPACILWATLYVSVSAAAAGTYRDLADGLHVAGYLFVGVIAVFLLAALGGRRLLQFLERRHLDVEDESTSAHAADVEDWGGDLPGRK